MKLSLCMIVKNEEQYLPKCLASAKPWVDEIVVVDTGSTDRTVQIAESFGARVLHFPWAGDFSAARNHSLDAATGDWIMFLDADEEIVDGDGPRLRELLDQPGYSGWYLHLLSFIGDKPGGEAVGHVAFRLFTHHPKHRFTGRLHEQVLAAVQLNGGRIGFSNVRLYHYGYLNKPTVEKDKVSRNFQILLKEVKDRPDDPFVHFNLGVEYMRQGKSEQALDAYQKAFKHLPTLEMAYASVLVRNIVLCLISLERYDEALSVLKDALVGFPDYTDLIYLKARVYEKKGDYETAIQLFQKCLKQGESASRHISQVGVGGYKAWQGIGDCLVRLGDEREAVKAYTKALYKNRRFLAPAVPLVGILLDHEPPSEVLAFLETLVDMADVDNLVCLSSVFSTKGQHEQALELLRRAAGIEQQARIDFMIGEALLNLTRYDEAIAALECVPEDSQYHAAALLDQVFCHLVCGQKDQAAEVLAKVTDASSHEEVLKVYRTLLSLLRGEVVEPLMTAEPEAQKRLEGTAWDLLQKLLETQSFDLFEQALKLLPLIGVPPEAAELGLGKLYQAFGYRESAVEELGKAVAKGTADAEALQILGDLCRAQGLNEDAVNFYHEAVKREPTSVKLYTSLVASLASLRRYAEAAQVLRKASERLPSSELLKQTLKGIEVMARKL